MKIAILSDIHGNLPALEAVLKEVNKQEIDHIFILGDLLGYYYQAQEVYEALKDYSQDIIAGNHERIFLDYIKGINQDEIDKKYGLSYKYYKECFSDELINKITQLPRKKQVIVDNLSILLTHSHPEKEDAYVYPDEFLTNLEGIEKKGVDFVFMGHTHYPMIFKGVFSLIINVGSVGQSRTKGGIANWGILNTKNKVYTPQNTSYDIQSTIENLELHNEHKEYLFKILKR